MKKFDGKSNAYGKIIEKYRKSKSMSRADVSRELDLIDVPINPDELYRIERQNMILKDYELIAICMILDIDYNDLIKVIKKKK
ncbi:MAG: helix-turn-helix transcriptional regulator [Clostridia bacterium]|nr:helix-turn-helix transcriptional regulator [Clostridia bacterium]